MGASCGDGERCLLVETLFELFGVVGPERDDDKEDDLKLLLLCGIQVL
jgi:hypothetical protein